MKDPEEKRQER